ncbi:ABC transporter ATP-binding protein [Paeniroseomonas aquatica]|uniref:ABC transporter ATP-binding protein n=1 Tax=Paeniroseomonas aquatica TaxID=373043 RepID=A0ABT8A0X3_9PROT|nr:ABC transporter ATP-binding protein [Paeniroseomonas aquatica]MDN3563329.1 ABC transporter ATP-binding protein [Paeniroseomonas aquatica]
MERQSGGGLGAVQRLGAPLSQAKLRIDGIAKRYGPVVALEPVSLEVRTGELMTILGPSGSGKTTLLQVICGLVEPDGGRLFIDGHDRTAMPVHQRDIGLVFQNYALFPHLTVGENIGFPLKMRGRPAAEVRERVAAALAMVQLGHLAARFPRELSGGQQQRVALARCFVYQPAIILMDEPLGALDRQLREHMQIEIKKLHRETGATIVYVTHDQEEALALSDRICLMNHARIEQVGTPQEIYAHPRTTFTASFIGTSTLLRGVVEGDALVTPLGRFALPEGRLAGAAALVIRPEHLRLGAGENTIEGVVSETVYAGAETRLLFDLADGTTAVLRLPTGMAAPEIGTAVQAHWATDAAVLVPL